MTALTASQSWRSHWSTPTLAGKKIVLAGRMSKWEKSRLVEIIEREKGKIVDQVEAGVHFVVILGAASLNNPPAAKKAEQLNKKSNAGIEIIELEDFKKQLAPTVAETVEMLRAGASALERWSQLFGLIEDAISLSGCDLRGAKLVGFSLDRLTLDGVDLRKADLSKSQLENLTDVRLDGAILTDSSIESLNNCSLVGVDAAALSMEQYSHNKGTPCNADFSKAKLIKARFFDCRGPEAKFTKADLSQAIIDSSKFPAVDFSGAKLCNASLRESEFENGVFAKADLTALDAPECKFQGADFRGAKLRGANFFRADLTDAQFDGADVEGANFAEATFDVKQLAKAKGKPCVPPTFTPGPRFHELEAAIKKAGYFNAHSHLKVGEIDYNVSFFAQKGRSAKAASIDVSRESEDDDTAEFNISAGNIQQAFTSLLAYLGAPATIHPEDVSVSSKGLLDVGCGGICEVFGVVAPRPKNARPPRSSPRPSERRSRKRWPPNCKAVRPA